MKKIITFLIFAIISQSCGNEKKTQDQESSKKPSEINKSSTQIDKVSSITTLNINEIPSEIQFEGKIKNAVKWTDKLGINIVITTETGIY